MPSGHAPELRGALDEAGVVRRPSLANARFSLDPNVRFCNLGHLRLLSRAVREEHPHVNPGWDSSAQPLAEFTDIRELQRLLKAQGYSYSRRPTTAQPRQRALSLWTRMGILFWSISTCELESYSRALCAVGERDTAERRVNQARRCGHEFLRRTMPHDSRGRSLRCRCGRQAAGAAIVTQP